MTVKKIRIMPFIFIFSLVLNINIVGAYDALTVLSETQAGEQQIKDKAMMQALTQKAESQDAKAQFELGLIYLTGNDRNDIKKTVANKEMGFLAYISETIIPDAEKAKYWLTKSSEQNYAPAQSEVALMYENGHGVTQDLKKAVELYTLSAKQNFALAQNNLARLYFMDKGAPKDIVKSYAWSKIALENGSESVKVGLNFIEAEITAEEKKKAEVLKQQIENEIVK